MDKKEVLIVASHFSPNFGGVETHLNDLVRALAKREWNVYVATYKPLARNIKVPFVEKKKRLGIYRMPWLGFNIVHRLTPYPILEFIYLFPGLFVLTGYVLLTKRDIKVLHAQGLVPAVISILWGKILRKRVIVSTHNLYFFPKSGLYKDFSKVVFSNADEVLCLSQQSQEEMARIGVPSEKLKPFRYWLNLDLFKKVNKNVAKKNLELSGRFVVFFVGRLIETKGVLVLLDSSKKKSCKDITFVIGGDGPLAAEVQCFADKNENIKYAGYLTQDKVMSYMNAADIVAVPSLVDEGYGRVAMEAIACGTPVLAAKRGGLSEVVVSEIGRLIEPTADEYSKHLSFFKKNRKLLDTLSRRARKYALDKFGEKNVESIIFAYQNKVLQ
ncbi:MAG TPA: glycosyltransferase family 4 protein [Patescibacteria group bacterium]